MTVVSRRASRRRRSVQQVEGVGAGRDVVLAGTDERAQPVTGDDLVRREVLGRPGRLPGGTGPGEHHDARRRQMKRLGHVLRFSTLPFAGSQDGRADGVGGVAGVVGTADAGAAGVVGTGRGRGPCRRWTSGPRCGP